MSEISNQMSVIRRLSPAASLPALHRAMTEFSSLLAGLASGISSDDQAPPDRSALARGATFWLTALCAECDDLLGELRYLAPWLDEAPPAAYSGTGLPAPARSASHSDAGGEIKPKKTTKK